MEGELVGRGGSETTGGYRVMKELEKIPRSMDDDRFGSQCRLCRTAVAWLVERVLLMMGRQNFEPSCSN